MREQPYWAIERGNGKSQVVFKDYDKSVIWRSDFFNTNEEAQQAAYRYCDEEGFEKPKRFARELPSK